MLETIRDFAAEQLSMSGEMIQVERAFEAFLIRRAEAAEAGLSGPEQSDWLERLEAEHDNLRAALGRVMERRDGSIAVRLAPRLREFWRTRGYPKEGRSWLEQALAIADEDDIAERASIEFGLGKLSIDLGDFTAANQHFRACIAMRRNLGDPGTLAEALSALSPSCW